MKGLQQDNWTLLSRTQVESETHNVMKFIAWKKWNRGGTPKLLCRFLYLREARILCGLFRRRRDRGSILRHAKHNAEILSSIVLLNPANVPKTIKSSLLQMFRAKKTTTSQVQRNLSLSVYKVQVCLHIANTYARSYANTGSGMQPSGHRIKTWVQHTQYHCKHQLCASFFKAEDKNKCLSKRRL